MQNNPDDALPSEMVDEAEKPKVVISIREADQRKARYLSYRTTGFSDREAALLSGVDMHTVRRWRREDSELADIEANRLPDIRRKMGADYTLAEFLRNMRLVLKKDFDVLWRANAAPETLTSWDKQYMMLIRRMYTPESLIALDKVLNGGGSGEIMDFSNLVKSLHQINVGVQVNVPDRLGNTETTTVVSELIEPKEEEQNRLDMLQSAKIRLEQMRLYEERLRSQIDKMKSGSTESKTE
jgi:hypothetical protein